MAWVTKSSDEQYTPEPAPKEYTKQEKAANWWHYNKITVLVVLLAVVLAGWLIHDMFFRVQPDLEIGYVGSYSLPTETAEALQEALVPYVADRNGDGKVVVQLSQFAVDFSTAETADASRQLAGTTQLTAALDTSSETYLFLLEDPAGFENMTQALRYTDGTLPETTEDWQRMVYRWQDCPVLAALDLGEVDTGAGTVTGQSLLEGVYIGFRGDWTGEAPQAYTDNAALWDALTAGAAPLEG